MPDNYIFFNHMQETDYTDFRELYLLAERLRGEAELHTDERTRKAIELGSKALFAQAEALERKAKKGDSLDSDSDSDSEPTGKKRWFAIQNADKETCLIVQTPEDINRETLLARIGLSRAKFDEHTRQGKRNKAFNYADLFQRCPRKILVDNDIWVKCKDPVEIIPCNG